VGRRTNYHLVASARRDGLLFTDASEGARLWQSVVAAAPGLQALVLMPDHLHLLHPHDVRHRLADALGRYARWRNHRRGLRGPLFERLPPASLVVGARKQRRTVRYLHLNPCRGGLVDDPLAWPWSTHRDRVGLSLDLAVAQARQPRRFHRYVSGDPSVHPEGTDLPTPTGVPPSPTRVRAVVASLARVPVSEVQRRGRWRSVYLSVAYALCTSPRAEIRAAANVGKGALVRPIQPKVLRILEGVVNDRRVQAPEETLRVMARAG